MSHHDLKMPGAAPVSRIEVLDAQSLFLITALRKAQQGNTHAADALWEGLALNIGVEYGQEARSTFDHLMALLSRHARRPLVTHDGSCSCVGADEAVFAQFVCLAALGEPEDAMLMGMLMLRADIVPLAVGLAQQIGLLTRVSFGVRQMQDVPQASHAYH